jgi:hypothetical protein
MTLVRLQLPLGLVDDGRGRMVLVAKMPERLPVGMCGYEGPWYHCGRCLTIMSACRDAYTEVTNGRVPSW